MLTFMLPGSLAALSTQAAAVGPVARDGAVIHPSFAPKSAA